MKLVYNHRHVTFAAIVTLGVLIGSSSYAAIGLTLASQPSFGLLISGASNRNFVLNSNGAISGTNSSDYISGAVAGQITVTDDASPVSISILVDNISTFGGLTVNQVLCSYNGGAQVQCDGGGTNETSVSSAALKIGLDITTTQVHSGGDTASASMNVNVIYN